MARRQGPESAAEVPADEPRRGRLARLVGLALLAGIGVEVVRRLRQRELDEAIWEDPPTA